MTREQLIQEVNKLNKEGLIDIIEHSLFELRHQLYENKPSELEIKTMNTMIHDLIVYKNPEININDYFDMEYDVD